VKHVCRHIALLAALTMPSTDFFRFAGREHSGGPVAQAKVTSDITLSVGTRSAWLCQIARFSGRTRPAAWTRPGRGVRSLAHRIGVSPHAAV